ncbi:VCBS repeat-containing protein [Peribacillus simplex]|uniref:VCBS repeat-containing protein n=1 Tax=Peribacillus simplex TaxID=1478 RepID=A0AAW7IC22_9BACI|nr:VCBS repeat-containing protein [Peribacillus simplex]MDM5294650.1 VCBS repeat-containing protein [Peribacillus simplex]MDM5453603.1 VCBS repeat-containing protein [Peribacillus simplex]
MKKIILFILLSSLVLNLSPIIVQADKKLNKELMNIVNEFKPSNSLIESPDKPFPTKSIKLYDFNQDGRKEIIVTFEVKAKEQPSSSQYGAMVLKKVNNKWEKIWETRIKGVDLDFSGLADITGDGTKEYLFGVTIGAALGSKLKIFQWNDNSFKNIAEVLYHEIDILNGNQKEGLAVWRWYLAECSLVDVLKWNGDQLVYDKELFSKYYPVIEKFYNDKISKMDAWFYWYCLADAQIKANLFEEASKSIEKGSLLAKKLSMPEGVQNFNKLRDRLEEKKKSL